MFNSQNEESYRVQTPTQNKRNLRQQLLPEQSIQQLLKLSNPQWQQLIEEFIRESFSTRPDTATTSIKLEQFNQSDMNSRLLQFLLQKTQKNWQSQYKDDKSQLYQKQNSTIKNEYVPAIKLDEAQISLTENEILSIHQQKDFIRPFQQEKVEKPQQSTFQFKTFKNSTDKVNKRYQQQTEQECIKYGTSEQLNNQQQSQSNNLQQHLQYSNSLIQNSKQNYNQRYDFSLKNQSLTNGSNCDQNNQQLESNYIHQQQQSQISSHADSPTFIKRNKKIITDDGDISGNELKQIFCWQWQSFEMFLQTINQQPQKVDKKNDLAEIRESDEKQFQDLMHEAQSSSKNKISSFKESVKQIRFVEGEQESSIGSNQREYPVTKFLSYHEILKTLLSEINNQESVHLSSQPYLSKLPQEKNKKFCCFFFRRRPPETLLMTHELIQEKLQILRLKDIQIDLQIDLHRSILLSISKGLGNYEKLCIPSPRWQIMGFQFDDPITEMQETGLFGLVQILFAITYFREVIIIFCEIMKIHQTLRLGSLMIQISSTILSCLNKKKLDQLLILYKKNNCLNSLNQLFMAILCDIIKKQRLMKQPFLEQSIRSMLISKENQDAQSIASFVKQFSKDVDNLYKEIEL